MKVGTLLHPAWLAESLLDPKPGGILAPLIERCVDYGARHIELTGEMFTLAPKPLFTQIEQEIRDVLVPYKTDKGLSFSLHLPNMGGLDLSSSIDDIRRVTIETHRRIVEIVHPLDPENFVLHIAGMAQEAAGGMFTGGSAGTLRTLLLGNVTKSLETLFRFLKPEEICVENLLAYPMDFIGPLVEDLGMSVCLDVGHLAVRGEPLDDFLGRYGRRVREVHLHDVKKVRYGPFVSAQIDHHALGQGELPVERVLRDIQATGFTGPIVLETLHDSQMISIERLKTLLNELRDKAR
jgi:sugar phosphate isomerase/epimerase